MKMKLLLAAAMIAGGAGNALAAGAKQIAFLNIIGQPTGCGMAITFSSAKVLPSDPESLAAAKPTGNCAGDGVAVGAIGVATVAGETGNFLSLGQNLASNKKVTFMYVIQLNTKRKLFAGGAWAVFDTMDGKTVNVIEGGTYTLSAP